MKDKARDIDEVIHEVFKSAKDFCISKQSMNGTLTVVLTSTDIKSRLNKQRLDKGMFQEEFKINEETYGYTFTFNGTYILEFDCQRLRETRVLIGKDIFG